RAGRRIEQIQPVVRQETVVERDAKQTVLDLRFDINVAGQGDGGVLRFPDFDVAGALDVEHPAVGSDTQLQRVRRRVVQDHLLIIRVYSRAGVGRLGAGGELDSAQQMCLE